MTLREQYDVVEARDTAKRIIELLISGHSTYTVSQMVLVAHDEVKQINSGNLYFDYKLQYPLTNGNNKLKIRGRDLL